MKSVAFIQCTYNTTYYIKLLCSVAILNILELLRLCWCWCKVVNLGPMSLIDLLCHTLSQMGPFVDALTFSQRPLAWLGLSYLDLGLRSKVLSLRVLINHSQYRSQARTATTTIQTILQGFIILTRLFRTESCPDHLALATLSGTETIQLMDLWRNKPTECDGIPVIKCLCISLCAIYCFSISPSHLLFMTV